MDTPLIDQLLQTVCSHKASALHLAVGSQPVIVLEGQAHPVGTKVLDAADTLVLMNSITPKRCQQELRSVGRTDFGFAFGELARFRVAVSEQGANIGLVIEHIPNEFPTGTVGVATPD
jgi:twitching motility protein PilT